MPRFHPDLAIARFIPPLSFGPTSTNLINRIKARPPQGPADLTIEQITVPGSEESPRVPVRVYRPRSLHGAAPALLWIHGGGMITGNPLADESSSIAFARTLGITVVSVEYRLSPAHPAPAALDDCYAVLRWMIDNADEQMIDPDRVAIGGASAGGGLAAGVTLLAHDREQIRPAFQLLVYPMIDDRTVTRTDHDVDGVRMWTKKSNRYGWTSYLGHEPGQGDVSDYAAPARRADLSGLPPTWIGVGTFDLFHDEDVLYAHRLRGAGVACDLEIIQGAFHGFDAIFPKKPVSEEFWRSQAMALETALFPIDEPGTDA